MSAGNAKLIRATSLTSTGWHVIRANLFQMDHKLDADRPRYGIRRFECVHLPDIDVIRDEGTGQRFILRTPQHIKQDAIRDFIVTLPLTSHSVVRRGEQDTLLDPGSFGFISTAAPFIGTVRGAGERRHFAQILARLPGDLVRKLLPAVDSWPDLSIRIRPGAGRLMASMLEWALRDGSSLSKPQALQFSRTLLDTIVGAITDAPETRALVSEQPSTSHERVRDLAMTFIAQHISNPALDVAMIARHCKVSERYLHAAFAAASLKVGSYIRQTRLEQCRTALLNPANRSRSITEIALSWGFVDPNSFGRAYKAWCGRTPSQERVTA